MFKKASYAFTALALIVGLWGLYLRLTTGHLSVNYGTHVVWGLWVAAYVYLVWLEVGTLLVYTSLNYIFGWNKALASIKGLVYLTALAALTPALLLIALDLGKPFRFWRAILTPNFGSPMAWMVWLHVIYLVFLLVKLVLVMQANRNPAKAEGINKTLKTLAYTSLPFGIALIITVGSIFGVLSARPLWQGSVLPLYFLIYSLIAGSGLVTLLYVSFASANTSLYAETTEKLGALMKSLLVFGAVAVAILGLVALYPNVPAQAEVVRSAIFGSTWWIFWLMYVGLGIVLPLILLVVSPKAKNAIRSAAALVVTMLAGIPYILIVPAQSFGLTPFTNAYTGAGLTVDYAPAVLEWQVAVFALGLGIAIFLAALRFLPVRAEELENNG
ncbi:MAG: polysulfide reductase NrfD [Chloroflexi bacterium]|nr:polysulfide reductase NrfD [Chloroflexota bacterium]